MHNTTEDEASGSKGILLQIFIVFPRASSLLLFCAWLLNQNTESELFI